MSTTDSPHSPGDVHWMQAALQQAHAAAQAGEVPVGAVVVHQGQVMGRGFNQPIALHDPSAHAEVQALREAAQTLGNYRLDDCTLYVTLEPCAMCVGAILHARLARVVWGAAEPRMGAGGSVVNLFAQPSLNHHTQTTSGVLAKEAAALLSNFFSQRRRMQRQTAKANHPLREDALRTPENCFSADCDCAISSYFYSDWPSLAGWRLHVKDSAEMGASNTVGCTQRPAWLMLAASPAHQGLFRDLALGLTARGDRVVIPDWIGMGRSDKPKKEAAIGDAQHLAVLHDLVALLNIVGCADRLHIVAHGDAVRLALALCAQWPALHGADNGGQCSPTGLWLINPLLTRGHHSNAGPLYRQWLHSLAQKPRLDIAQAVHSSATDQLPAADVAQWAAQFPDPGFRAALRAWARDASGWLDGSTAGHMASAASTVAAPAKILLSWGTQARWWPAPLDIPESEALPKLLPPGLVQQWLPLPVDASICAAHHQCAGGDWLPLQNAAALLAASQFFDSTQQSAPV